MKSLVLTAFPFMRWLSRYRPAWLRHDLMAGGTVGLLLLPQAVAVAAVAGLPIEYGIYACIFPTIIASMYGSSHHMVTTPTNPLAIMALTSLTPLATSPENLAQLSLILAFVMGVIQFAMGFARVGKLVDFISSSVLIGFTAGAAVLIVMSQLDKALGLPLDNQLMVYEIVWVVLTRFTSINPWAVGMTMLTIGLVLAFQGKSRFPAQLVTLAIVTLFTYVFSLENRLATVGYIDFSMPGLSGIEITFQQFRAMTPTALALVLLGLISSSSISKSISLQSRQQINSNREFIGQGLANIVAAFTKGMPVCGSFNLSATMWKSQNKTALAVVFATVVLMLTVLLLNQAIRYIPLSSIAGILFITCWKMVDRHHLALNLRSTRGDALTVAVTFFATLLLSLEFAIFIGVLLSIGLYLARTAMPYMRALKPSTPGGSMEHDEHDIPCPQMGIVGIDGSVFFGSAEYIRTDLTRYLDNHPDMQNLLIRMHNVEVLDASGITALEAVHDILHKRGGRLSLAGLSRMNTQVLNNSGLMHLIGTDYVRLHTANAMTALFQTFEPKRCYHCPYAHFKECRKLKKRGRVIIKEEEQLRRLEEKLNERSR